MSPVIVFEPASVTYDITNEYGRIVVTVLTQSNNPTQQ